MMRQLAQLTPGDTNAATLYQVGERAAGAHGILPTGEGIVRVCNTGTSLAKFRLFHDYKGATYDDSTALEYDREIAPGPAKLIPVPALTKAPESIGVRTDTINDLTFTYEAPTG